MPDAQQGNSAIIIYRLSLSFYNNSTIWWTREFPVNFILGFFIEIIRLKTPVYGYCEENSLFLKTGNKYDNIRKLNKKNRAILPCFYELTVLLQIRIGFVKIMTFNFKVMLFTSFPFGIFTVQHIKTFSEFCFFSLSHRSFK